MEPKTAAEIGNLIKSNQIIRYIDLEYNNLTNSGSSFEGIKSIAEVFIYLKVNKNKHNIALFKFK
jgi:hypothetical protein